MSLGNPTNPDGTKNTRPGTPGMLPSHPGVVSHGPAHNKVKMHLTASKGKIPAEMYAHAVAARQALKPRLPAKVIKHGELQKKPAVYHAQVSNPPGVKPYDKKPASPASKTLPNVPDKPGDSAAVEAVERRKGIYT